MFQVSSNLLILRRSSSTSSNFFLGELIHVLNISKPRIVFCSASTLTNVIKAKDDIPSIEKIILLGGTKINGLETLEEILLYTSPLLENEIPNIDLEQCAAILYSSGTTGPSKGVMVTQRNLFAALNIQRYLF